jgi:hypothetical protein
MSALATTSSDWKLQTCLLVREGASHQQTRNCLTVIKIWSALLYKPSSFLPICLMYYYSLQIKMGLRTKKKMVSRWVPDTKTDW